MKTIYLSGPITGIQDENRPAFEAAKAALLSRGYDVLTPFDINPKPTSLVPAMRRDVAAMLTLCSEVWLLPGWEQSSGSVGEASIARWLGMSVRLIDPARLGCYEGPGEIDAHLVALPAPGALRRAERRTNETRNRNPGRGPVVNAKNFDLQALLRLAHSPVHNYAIPGLSSYLIGAPSEHGTVRLFRNERNHQEPIVPHSHRFDFMCWVLSGIVTNRVWSRHYGHPREDKFASTTLRFGGECGKYTKELGEVHEWSYTDHIYAEGECYSMRAQEVHSIYFSRGATVLFFEGPTKSETSIILEPFVGGEKVETFKVEPWMFKREVRP